MSAANFILSLARKLLARESKGITTIPNRMAAEQKAAEIVVKLENAGLPLNRANEFIRSEQDLIRILNMIENTPPVMREVPSGIRSTESAKVFDIKGKEIKDTKNIIGGEEVKETEGAIKSRLEKGNKESAQRIRMKKMVDDAIDNMSPSLSGDMRTDAALVAEDMAESMGKVYDDLPTKERLDLYDEAYTALSKQKYKGMKKPKDADDQESSYDDGPADFDPDADNETFATGGRAGFSNGSKGLLDILNIQAEGSKSGKQQIYKAPEGFTVDTETYNIILNADIPIDEKINLLATYARGKGRERIEKDGSEFILGEGGSRIREVGLDFNPDGEGISGQLMYDVDKGEPRFDVKFKKSFASGGRAGYKFGLGPLFNFLNKKSPAKAYTDYLKSVKERMKAGKEAEVAGEVIPIAAGGALITNQLKKKLKRMNEEQKKRIEEEAQKELRKDMKKADGGRIGYFMGGANPKGLGLLRQILKHSSKTGKEQGKFKGVDLSALDMLRLSNPKRFNRLLADVRGKVNIREGIMGTDTVRAQQQALREQRKNLTAGALKVAKDMKTRDDEIAKRIAEEAEKTIIPRTKIMMMDGMGMSEEAAEKAARDLAKAGQNMRLIDDSPQITDEGLLQLENILKNMETGGKKKRELNATGGRIGFKDGMTRRTFLKLLGGVMSIPIIGKVIAPLKLAKGVSKVPIIKTDNVPGKPEWFDALVNKVIIEGDDVTKKFATAERQSIHQKTLDDGSVVRVTEDVDDGAVRVEYESEQNVFGDPVQLQYKKPLPDEGDPRPVGEFTTAESGPVGRVQGPDDFDIDVDEVGGTSISDLDSDVSKLKEYATGKGPTMKEFIQNKKRKDKAKSITEDPEAQSDAIIKRQGDYDPSDYDDYASGGIARMLGE